MGEENKKDDKPQKEEVDSTQENTQAGQKQSETPVEEPSEKITEVPAASKPPQSITSQDGVQQHEPSPTKSPNLQSGQSPPRPPQIQPAYPQSVQVPSKPPMGQTSIPQSGQSPPKPPQIQPAYPQSVQVPSKPPMGQTSIPTSGQVQPKISQVKSTHPQERQIPPKPPNSQNYNPQNRQIPAKPHQVQSPKFPGGGVQGNQYRPQNIQAQKQVQPQGTPAQATKTTPNPVQKPSEVVDQAKSQTGQSTSSHSTAPKTTYDKIYEFAVQMKKPFDEKVIQEYFKLEVPIFNSLMEMFTTTRVFERKDDQILNVIPPKGLVEYISREGDEVIEEREITWRSLQFHLKILNVAGESIPIYYVPPLNIGPGMKTMLKHIFNNLIQLQGDRDIIDLDMGDPKKYSKDLAKSAILNEMNTSEKIADKLSDALIYEFSEIGCLNLFLLDKDIEEVVFNGCGNPIALYSRKHGWVKTNIMPMNESALIEIAHRMARLAQKEINFKNPIVETRLQSGDRVNTLLNTISSQGTIITIRKFSRNPWTIVGLIKELETLDIEIASLIWFAVEYGLNIMIAGGSGSGKTSLLNSVCNLIPSSLHVLSIESVREIHFSKSRAWNWMSLVADEEAKKHHADTVDLLNISLKMRPERIIMGEALRPEEIRAAFQAMQVGHPVYSTIHATSTTGLMRRIMDPVYQIPNTDIYSLDLVLVMYHDIKEKTRKIIEVSEIEYEGESSIVQHKTLKARESESSVIRNLFILDPKEKKYSKPSAPRKIFDKVQVLTGMSRKDIEDDLLEKQKILEWAIEKDLSNIHQFEEIVEKYYEHKENLIKQIENGTYK